MSAPLNHTTHTTHTTTAAVPAKQAALKTESTTAVKDVPISRHAVTAVPTAPHEPNWHEPIQSTEKTTVMHQAAAPTTAVLHTTATPANTNTAAAYPVTAEHHYIAPTTRETVVKQKELLGDERMDPRVTVEHPNEKTPAWYQPKAEVEERSGVTTTQPAVVGTTAVGAAPLHTGEPALLHGQQQGAFVGTRAAAPPVAGAAVLDEKREKALQEEREKALKEQDKAAKDAAKEQEKLAKAQEDEQKKLAKEQEKAVEEQEKAAKEQHKESEKAAKEHEKAVKHLDKVQHDAAKEIEKQREAVAKAEQKAAKDVAKVQTKAAEKIAAAERKASEANLAAGTRATTGTYHAAH